MKDLLSGTWLGHQLHPLLTDIPIGSFTSATILDLVGGRSLQPAANLLAGIGVVSTVPTAAAGLADWSDTYGPGRRVGVVHAAANVVGVGFYTASIVARHRGKRFSATALGFMGMGVMTAGGIPRRPSQPRPRHRRQPHHDGRPVLRMDAVASSDDLVEGKPLLVELGDVPVLLYRSGGMPYAISNRCTHAGGPLNEGAVRRGVSGRALRHVSVAPERVQVGGRNRRARSGNGAGALVRGAYGRRQAGGASEMTAIDSEPAGNDRVRQAATASHLPPRSRGSIRRRAGALPPMHQVEPWHAVRRRTASTQPTRCGSTATRCATSADSSTSRFNKVGQALAFAGVTVGRLKTNGRIFSYSPLSRVIELEAMTSGVLVEGAACGSRCCSLADVDSRLDKAALNRHLADAERYQLEALRNLHDQAIRDAFM